jgi:hypothetical protein
MSTKLNTNLTAVELTEAELDSVAAGITKAQIGREIREGFRQWIAARRRKKRPGQHKPAR